MASALLPLSPPRVSSTADRLLSLVSGVDSYHSRVAVAHAFNDAQMMMNQDERSALGLIVRGLCKLFPFDPCRDQEHHIQPRHAL